MTNKQISKTFGFYSKLLDIHGEAKKAKMWSSISVQVDRLSSALDSMTAEEIQGVASLGKSSAQAIIELCSKHTFSALESLKNETPNGILEMVGIRGIGPKKIGRMWQELKIDNVSQLIESCKQNKLIELKGFAKKSQASILEKAQFFESNRHKLLWAQAEEIIPFILDSLKEVYPESNVQIVGDYFLQKGVVEKVELVIGQADLSALDAAQGWERLDGSSFLFQSTCKILLHQADPSEVFELGFSEELREEARINEKELEGFPNFLRDNKEAMNLHLKGELPKIIQADDIQGIVHNHSTYSDGANSVREMAMACIERGMEYFVISDHSKTSFYANGLHEREIIQQHAEIDALNEELYPFRIFKSIECDILGDGSLDYDDDILASFDLVICSIHQNLEMTLDKAMHRLLSAVENPFTNILGHPTGRLLLSRKAYPVDHTALIDACAENEVVIELNANPHRLDMDADFLDYALKKNVVISINPDAHSISQIDYTRYGVQVAQRAMWPSSMNLSSFSLEEFEEYLIEQHAKRPV